MIHLAKLEITLHGLRDPTKEKVLNRIQVALLNEFLHLHESDIEIEVIEVKDTCEQH